MHVRFRRPSVSTVISLVALFIALGGSATAAIIVVKKPRQLGKNVVTSAKIKKKAIRSRHIRPRAIRGRHIKPGTISTRRLTKGLQRRLKSRTSKSLAGEQGARGGTGAKGPSGDKGPRGDRGSTGKTGSRGDSGPSSVRLAGTFSITALGGCKWEGAPYESPELGQSTPELERLGVGRCRVTFYDGTDVRLAFAQVENGFSDEADAWVKTTQRRLSTPAYVDVTLTFHRSTTADGGLINLVAYQMPDS